MPLLYYGNLGSLRGRKLYKPGLRPVETAVFDSFKIKGLSPLSSRRYVANLWWLEKRKHSAISWSENCDTEQAIFIPGFLDWGDTIALAREHFKDVVPSAIVFRLNNHDGAYLL